MRARYFLPSLVPSFYRESDSQIVRGLDIESPPHCGGVEQSRVLGPKIFEPAARRFPGEGSGLGKSELIESVVLWCRIVSYDSSHAVCLFPIQLSLFIAF